MSRVILDEGVPRPLARALRDKGIDATPFPAEWKQMSNGLLLNEIERAGFDVLITCDKNMMWQQSLASRKLAVLVLPDNRLRIVLSLSSEIASGLANLPPGTFTPLISGN